ncbi:MAG: prolyl aminopeptidase, partial [Rubrivivax sp.]|nr:prolyl aminopeptidase [Rubrivivax sp.]
LRIVADAGHAPTHPAMAAAMRAALDRFATGGAFDDPAAR